MTFRTIRKMRSTTPTTILFLNVEFTVQLSYLSNFWISLNLFLINNKVDLDLLRKKDCVR